MEVLSPARRGGLPDLLVGVGFHTTLLVEVKEGSQKLSEDQVKWHASWRGAPVHVVRKLEDVGALVRAVEGKNR